MNTSFSNRLLLFFILLTVNSVFAQEDNHKNRFTFGIGISFDQEKFYIPIDILRSFRLEPEIFISTSYRESGGGDRSESKTIHAGVGIFPTFNYKDFKLYSGLRVGYSFYSYKYDENSREEEGYYINPTLGGEYFLIKRFSLGGEVHLRYTSLENFETYKINTSASEKKDYNSLRFSTVTLFFLRLYIW